MSLSYMYQCKIFSIPATLMRDFITFKKCYFSHNIIKGAARRFSINCSAAIIKFYWLLINNLP